MNNEMLAPISNMFGPTHLPKVKRPDYEVVEAIRDITITDHTGRIERVIPCGTRGIRHNCWQSPHIDGEPPTIFHGMDTAVWSEPPAPHADQQYTISDPTTYLRVVPREEHTLLEEYAAHRGNISYSSAKFELIRKLLGMAPSESLHWRTETVREARAAA